MQRGFILCALLLGTACGELRSTSGPCSGCFYETTTNDGLYPEGDSPQGEDG